MTTGNTANAAPAASLPPSIIAAPYKWLDPSQMLPRPWIYGQQLLRGSVSMIIAPGGAGKTALATGMALSLVTGRDFMGSKVWHGPKKVWLWSLEDSIEELSLGVQAAASYWDISEDDQSGKLFLNSALNGDHLKLVSNRSGKLAEDYDLAEAIVTELKGKAIDVLFIDPFVSSHDANENDNKSMDAVVKLLALIAYEANCSIVLLHHTHKGFGHVNENSARGASAVVNAARSVMTINPLTKDEGDAFGLNDDDLGAYIKLYDHKNNRTSSIKSATCMKFESVSIKTNDGGEESIGVLAPAKLEAFEVPLLTEDQIARIQMEMIAGFDRKNFQSPHWIGRQIGKMLKIKIKERCDNKIVQKIISQLIDDDWIIESEKKGANSNTYISFIIGKKAKPSFSMDFEKPFNQFQSPPPN